MIMKTDDTPTKKRPAFSGLATDVVATLVSLVTGGYSSKVYMEEKVARILERKQSHSGMERDAAIDKLLKARRSISDFMDGEDAGRQSLLDRIEGLETGRVDIPVVPKDLDPAYGERYSRLADEETEAVQNLAKAHEKYFEDGVLKLETMSEQWAHLKTRHKIQVVAFGAAAASVALGVIMTMTQRISDRHRDERDAQKM